MNENSVDLDRRLAEQNERSKLRHVEFLEWIDERHQREKRARERYQRFKWLYWSAGIVVATIIALTAAGWGWFIGGFLADQRTALSNPKTVILQMQPRVSQEPNGNKP